MFLYSAASAISISIKLRFLSMKKKYLILSILVALLLFVLLRAVFDHYYRHPEHPVAKDGVMDLSNWDFEQNGSVRLNGEWSFFKNRLLNPEESIHQKRSGTIEVPKSWSDQNPGSVELPRVGHATYQLLVKLPKNPGTLGIKAEEISSSFKMFGNSQHLLSVGKPHELRKESREGRITDVVYVWETKGTLLLTIMVSNHTYKNSGIWRPVKLGLYRDLKKADTIAVGIDLFSIGGLLVMGFHCFGIYIYRRKEKGVGTEYLIFSAICFVFSIRAFFSGSEFFLRLFPSFPLEIDIKICFLTYYLLPPLFVLFFDQIFPEKRRKVLTNSSLIYFSILSAIVLVTNRKIFPWTVDLANLGTLMISFLLFLRVYRVIREDRENSQEAVSLVFGMAILIPTIINDILFSEGIIYTGYYGAAGMLCFLITMSFILSRRFSKAFVMIQSQNRELQRLNQVKDHFLANTSHELRTPLHAITGVSESLIDSCRCHENHESTIKNLSMIHSNAQYLTNLVNDILDTTVLKYQKLKMSPVSLNLYPIVRGMIDFYFPLVRKRKIRLVNHIPVDAPAVLADEFRLRQIFQNFLGNAIKFTTEGSVEIGVEQRDNFLEIAIRDTGQGIRQEEFETIFQPFEQGSENGEEKERGAGLGLYITKELVQLHGGTIRVSSNPGQGSTFTFTLPLSNKPAQNGPLFFSNTLFDCEEDSVDLGRRELEEQGKTWSVLVVDDDPINLQVVCEFLSEDCYNPIPCRSGKEALERVERHKPDLVLLDVMVPDIDGFEVCRSIRNCYSSRDLPIVFLTACNDAIQLIQGFDVGGNDYLTKPFSRAELIARITPLLECNIEKRRLSSLRKLSSRIGTDKRPEMLIRFAFQLLCEECYVLKATLYKEDSPIDLFHEGVPLSYLSDSERCYDDEEELIPFMRGEEHFLLIKSEVLTGYSLIFQCKQALNNEEKEFAESVIEQLKVIRNNEKSIGAIDPKLLARLHKVASKIEQVLYIQAADNYCVIHNKAKKTEIIRMPLKKMKQHFDDSYLIQIHRSYLVNPSKIKGVKKVDKTRYLLELNGTRETIPVGKKYLANIHHIFPDNVAEV